MHRKNLEILLTYLLLGGVLQSVVTVCTFMVISINWIVTELKLLADEVDATGRVLVFEWMFYVKQHQQSQKNTP